jgi:hypothetical protein
MIDQLLYEKYAGRRGSVDRRFGKAIAAFVEIQQRNHSAMDIPLSQRVLNALAISWIIVILLGAAVVLLLVYWRALFG